MGVDTVTALTIGSQTASATTTFGSVMCVLCKIALHSSLAMNKEHGMQIQMVFSALHITLYHVVLRVQKRGLTICMTNVGYMNEG